MRVFRFTAIPNDLSTDIAITNAEITRRQPAGVLPHEWK
jgi:hypothetical protein